MLREQLTQALGERRTPASRDPPSDRTARRPGSVTIGPAERPPPGTHTAGHGQRPQWNTAVSSAQVRDVVTRFIDAGQARP